MEKVYAIIFLVGVIYTIVTFLIGGLFDFAHIGGHFDTHIDMNIDNHGMIPFPIKPITIVSFITVFGGIGVIGTHYKLLAIITFILAIALAFIVSFLLYRFIVVPLYKAQNTSAVSQDKLIGVKADVISPILENGFGTIAYVVNGSKYNAPARHINNKAISQGEEVVIYEIKDNIFYVQPMNE